MTLLAQGMMIDAQMASSTMAAGAALDMGSGMDMSSGMDMGTGMMRRRMQMAGDMASGDALMNATAMSGDMMSGDMSADMNAMGSMDGMSGMDSMSGMGDMGGMGGGMAMMSGPDILNMMLVQKDEMMDAMPPGADMNDMMTGMMGMITPMATPGLMMGQYELQNHLLVECKERRDKLDITLWTTMAIFMLPVAIISKYFFSMLTHTNVMFTVAWLIDLVAVGMAIMIWSVTLYYE